MQLKKTRFLLLLLIAIYFIFICGCTKQNTLQVLGQQQVSYPGPPQLTQNSEKIMENAFLETGLPWSQEMVDGIARERNALIAMQEHLDSLLIVNSQIPYYVYRAKVEEVFYHYAKLQVLLDDRSTMPGAMTDQGLELYVRVRSDINQELLWQKERLNIETKNIDKEANKMDMDDIKNMYTAIKPLIGIAKKAIL